MTCLFSSHLTTSPLPPTVVNQSGRPKLAGQKDFVKEIAKSVLDATERLVIVLDFLGFQAVQNNRLLLRCPFIERNSHRQHVFPTDLSHAIVHVCQPPVCMQRGKRAHAHAHTHTHTHTHHTNTHTTTTTTSTRSEIHIV